MDVNSHCLSPYQSVGVLLTTLLKPCWRGETLWQRDGISVYDELAFCCERNQMVT